jgi:hypothetical protein
MECLRQTINSDKLIDIFDLPHSLRNKRVDVIVLPLENSENATKNKRKLDFVKVPPLPDTFFDPLSEEELQAWGL